MDSYIVITSPEIMIRDTYLNEGKYNWDMLIIDEGHKLKNFETQIRRTVRDFNVRNQKIILSGTPVQNNIVEFYSLLDLVAPAILGNK
jgi:SNF2 family DNA or RNA helicase